MVFSKKKNFARWFIIISSLVLVGLFVWNVSLFFDQLKKEERKKMAIWTKAYKLKDLENPLVLPIWENNTTTPMLLYSVKSKVYNSRNIPEKDVKTQAQKEALADKFKSEYEPIKVSNDGKVVSIVYYGNSDLVNELKYFPFIVMLVILLFIVMIYYFYKTSKSNEQNKLWAGMAKETAHQIGTPLSSLVGWAEILKTENVEPSYIEEMEKDIDRLNTITERFSKIGSVPKLEESDFVEATVDSYDYLKSRSSKLIKFSLQKPKNPVYVNLNAQLLSWTIENLVKNAIDALRGKGEVDLEITEDAKYAYLFLTDNGKGIAKKDFKTIFKPGETSKKRGWGLGLSLAKRIIEEYHDGKIKVLKSELGAGTTFVIKLRKV